MNLRRLNFAALVLFVSLGALGVLAGLVGLEAKALDLLSEDILLRMREPNDLGCFGLVMSFLQLLPSPPDVEWSKNRSYGEGFGHKVPLLREFVSARDKLTTARTLFDHWERRKRSFNALFLPKLLSLRLPEYEVIDWPVLMTAEMWVRTAALLVGYLLTMALMTMCLSSRFIASPEEKGQPDIVAAKDEKFKEEEEKTSEKSLTEELEAARAENRKLKAVTYQSIARLESIHEEHATEQDAAKAEIKGLREELSEKVSLLRWMEIAVRESEKDDGKRAELVWGDLRAEESLDLSTKAVELGGDLSAVEREVLQSVTELLTRQKNKLGRTAADFAMKGHLEGHVDRVRKLRGLDIEVELRRIEECGCQTDPLFKLSLRRNRRSVPGVDLLKF